MMEALGSKRQAALVGALAKAGPPLSCEGVYVSDWPSFTQWMTGSPSWSASIMISNSLHSLATLTI